MKPQNFLVISGHDFRTARKANVHFIVEELARLGPTRFFSPGFSRISNFRRRDARIGLEDRSNRVETVAGVECYLWRTWVHPGNLKYWLLRPLAPVEFELYRSLVPQILRRWACEATVIFIESGLSVLFAADLRRWNPDATIIYLASDDLRTIGVSDYLVRLFSKSARHMDGARLPSRKLVQAMPPGLPVFYVPHGLAPDLDAYADPSPYGEGIHAVSVGSMLFDPNFFEIAINAFPQITFHVIGSGAARRSLPARVKYYGELAHRETLPFIKHATFGVAPYRNAKVPYYLCDTSMKLMQYAHFGLPAVCSQIAVGGRGLRFGYTPGDRQSICAAIGLAMKAEHKPQDDVLTWRDVVQRLLRPEDFPDTVI